MRILVAIILMLSIGCERGLGDACEETKDCTHIDKGYCALTGICVATCPTEGAACSDDGICGRSQGRTVCLPRCESASDCRPGESCTGFGDGSVCLVSDLLARPESEM